MTGAYANAKLQLGFLSVDVSVFPPEEKTGMSGDVDSICSCNNKVKSLGFECETCGTHYAAAFQPPKYGYPKRPKGAKDWKYETIIPKAEVKVKEDRSPIEIIKEISFENLIQHFTINGTYYVLPEDAELNTAGAKLYKLYVDKLSKDNRALLANFVARGKKERYAIIADGKRGILLALKIGDMADLPYDPPNVQVSDMERKQIDQFIGTIRTDDVNFPAPADLLAKRIKEDLEKKLQNALGGKSVSKEELPQVDETEQQSASVSKAKKPKKNAKAA